MGVFDIFSSDNEEEAARLAAQGHKKGYGLASGLYGEGRDKATAGYGAAAETFKPILTAGLSGTSAYADASGANGPEGIMRARQTFEAMPGYTAGRDAGEDIIMRRNNALGKLASGNTLQDLSKFGVDYANQKFSDYQKGLSPLLQTGQFGVAGTAGAQTGLADRLMASLTGQGELGYKSEVGQGNALAAGELAKDQAGLNLLGAIFGGGNLAGKLFGLGGFGKA